MEIKPKMSRALTHQIHIETHRVEIIRITYFAWCFIYDAETTKATPSLKAVTIPGVRQVSIATPAAPILPPATHFCSMPPSVLSQFCCCCWFFASPVDKYYVYCCWQVDERNDMPCCDVMLEWVSEWTTGSNRRRKPFDVEVMDEHESWTNWR